MAALRTLAIPVLVAVLLAASCSSGSSNASPKHEPTASGCSPARTSRPTSGPQPFPYQGTPRSYLVALPHGYDGSKRVPLVFDFHGFLGTKEQQEVNTGMAKQGTAQGFVVVTPDSLGSPTQWNEFAAPGQADDFGFVDALLTGLSHRFCIDSTRVFAAGHSNGAAFAGFLVCKPPYRFAAVAMVSATTPTSCPKGVTPSALAIAGTADPQVPYAGGRVGDSVVQIPAATSTITAYATQYGCAQPGTDTTVASGVQQVRFAHCHDGAVVALDSVAGGTHAWPGGPAAAADPADSAAGKSFPATTAILRFFADAAPCTRRGC